MSTKVEMAKIRPDRGGWACCLPGAQGFSTPLGRLRHTVMGHPSGPPTLLQRHSNFRSGWKQSLFLLKTFLLVDEFIYNSQPPRYAEYNHTFSFPISVFREKTETNKQTNKKQMNKQTKKNQKGKWTRSKFLSQDSMTLSLDSHQLPAFSNRA